MTMQDMPGVVIDGMHTFKDFGLRWYSADITKPEVKKYTFEVPGRDGLLDVTESMGPPRYENRTLTLEFDRQVKSHEEYKQLESRLLNAFMGKTSHIRLDTDPGYYYTGRTSVETKFEKSVADVTITAEVFPYKQKAMPTRKEAIVSGTSDVAVRNARMPSVPVITVDSDVSISFRGMTLSFAPGEYRVADFMLLEGVNKFTVEGRAAIKFEYQEGEF